MNIFRLSDCPIEAARFHQDLHVRKIIVEASQLLANCYSKDVLAQAPRTQTGNIRGHSHIHHPISIWTKETRGNQAWVAYYAQALCDEYKHRFNKTHFCQSFINWILDKELFDHIDLENNETEQPQCFKNYPHLMVPDNPVLGYRNYYRVAKRSFMIRGKEVFATWTNREIPEWF